MIRSVTIKNRSKKPQLSHKTSTNLYNKHRNRNFSPTDNINNPG